MHCKMRSLLIIILTLLLTSTNTILLVQPTTTQFHHNRRILHQPFFPLHSLPPTTQPPFPSPPKPKYPFSSQAPTPTQNHFFPLNPFPPPPPPPPPPPSTTTTLPTSPANISSLILPQSPSKRTSRKLVAIAVSLSLLSATLIAAAVVFLLYRRRHIDEKADSIRLFPPNTATSISDSGPPPPCNESSTSSEFLYLGTPLNSRGVDDNYQKLGSPELSPLPPLPRQDFRRSYGNAEDEEDEVFEEFFSPRGSSGAKGTPDDGNRYKNTRKPSPNSRTASFPSSNSSSPSPSMSSTSSPSGQFQLSPVKVAIVSRQYVLPPPPPPLPPRRFWETTGVPSRIQDQIGSPVTSTKTSNSEEVERNMEIPKPKLKPLHWDKVRGSSDRAMVWDQLKSNSFPLNEEMIQPLFMMHSSNLNPKNNTTPHPVLPSMNQENRVLDPKKAQNIAILLRALNMTIDEVCEALLEGNTDVLGTELLESLLRMAPTKGEERKLLEYKDASPYKLRPAEKFLKAVLDIPFAIKRVEAMLYIANFDSELEYLKRSFETLEAACEELRNNRMLTKLLEAVLKTGNHMNVGTNCGDAHAFKLDTLLKLVDIKGTDGKTTLLHFVVQEIIRVEGSLVSGANQNPTAQKNPQSAFRDDVEISKLGLQVVSGLSGELTNVKKSAAMDSDVLSSEVTKLAIGITKIGEVVKLKEEFALKESSSKFSERMSEFMEKAEEEIIEIQTREKVVHSMVKEVTEYFHGNSAKEEAHPFRIFMVVRDFISILDRVCKEVGKINERIVVSSARQFPPPVNPSLPPVFPGLGGRQQYISSDEESSSSP